MRAILLAAVFFAGLTTMPEELQANTAGEAASFTETRPYDLWRYYMHGISDNSARSINLLSLFDESLPLKDWIEKDSPIENPFFKSTAPALKVGGGKSITLPKPLPIALEEARGKSIRVFVWIQGRGVGLKNSSNSYSDPPSMLLLLKNSTGKLLAKTTSLSGSTGDFPWHCYHKEVFIPSETDAVYVSFFNNCEGDAFFSNIAWEVVTRKYSGNERQDPTTGSWASNPWHDEMNQQFRFVKGYNVNRYKWRFFEGPAAGLVAQSYNISTVEGLQKYYREKVKTDSDHMNHSLMYFASRYHYGRERELLPETMDEEWLSELSRLVIENQDEDTGYWGTNSHPKSMGVTFHFLEGLFAYYGYKRICEEEEQCNPRRHLGVLEIPKARQIIETTLAMQAERRTPENNERLAAWPDSAYNFTTNPNASEQRASLAATGNAIDIIRRCERFVEAPLRQQAYHSIRASVDYVLRHCVSNDGLWSQADTDKSPTLNHHMHRILSASYYLERVPLKKLAPPSITARQTDEGLQIEWREAQEEMQNSVRLFFVPWELDFAKAGLTHLVGILHHRGTAIFEKDPFIVIRQMDIASQNRWGEGWPSNSYTKQKNREIPADIPFSINHEELLIPQMDFSSGALYAVAATWYGEESAPVLLNVAEPSPFPEK